METTLSKIKEKSLEDDEPLTLRTILDSNGIEDTFRFLRAVDGYDREMRIYAVWCASQVIYLTEGNRSIDALKISYLYAEGKATYEELRVARDAAWDAVDAARAARAATWAARATVDAARAARAATWATWATWDAARDASCDAAWAARAAARDAARDAAWDEEWDAAWDAADAAQKEEFIRMQSSIEKGETYDLPEDVKKQIGVL